MLSKLLQLSLQGFKSIGKEQKIRFGDITIFIGANGAGKSNIMSFFKMLNYSMTSSLAEFIRLNGEAATFIHLNKKGVSIHAKLDFESKSHHNSYAFTLAPTYGSELVFTGEELSTNKLPKGDIRSYNLPPLQKESALPEFARQQTKDLVNSKAIFSILRKCNFYQFHDTSQESALRGDAYINNAGYLMGNGGNLAAFLYGLFINDSFKPYYKRIVDNIKLAYPQFKDFVLSPKITNQQFIRLDWQDKTSPPNFRFGPHQLSDGTIRFMALTALLLQPPETMPNVIVIDEPELGLHPSAISLLANMINTASKNAQIVIATQSSEFLNFFEPAQIRIVEREGSDTIIKELDVQETKLWMDDYSLGEIWEKNIIGGRP